MGLRKGIPITADNRLQRYAYFLSGFRYKIEHISSKANANCDALSRLLIDDSTELCDTNFSYVYYFEEGIIAFDSKVLENESKKDNTISTIIKYVLAEWPNFDSLKDEVKAYYEKRYELTVDKGCLFWGLRACIPESMRSVILKELHASHMGIVKIKMFARSYVYWPGIDGAIENLVKECQICLIERKKPAKTPLTTWPWPTRTWNRIHCDFAGPFFGKMYLIVIDAHSKWLEIINFGNNTKACRLIEEFSTLFARFGLPLHVVTDNGPQFRSAEFKDFLARNGVHVSFSAHYHPATNGAAENFVQTFKDKVTKIVKGGESVEVAIKMFLFDYRSIPHTTTGQSPAYLMYGRNLRTRFDVLGPNVAKTVDEKQKAQITARSGNRTVDSLPLPLLYATNMTMYKSAMSIK